MEALTKITRTLLASPSFVFSAAILLRAALLCYGIFQDNHSPLKYTDIDYYVFTDAAQYVKMGQSPYLRDTYRYTPLLAWLLMPTTLQPQWLWFNFGKALFAISDVIAGWMILAILEWKEKHLKHQAKLNDTCCSQASAYAAIWLLNPMVATISTRGSSEGLLCVMVMGLLAAVEMQHVALAGFMLGLSVHFKIYPFIYGFGILLALEEGRCYRKVDSIASLRYNIGTFVTRDRIVFVLTSLATFSVLNIIMYNVYGMPFLQHTYLHHLTRIDHRHNFSPFNMLLYLTSSKSTTSVGMNIRQDLHFESLAFVPQLLLSTILIPWTLLVSKPQSQNLVKSDAVSTKHETSSSTVPLSTTIGHHLAATFLAQTHAFVTFNKVCTSQYFLWYLIFLPLYLPSLSTSSSLATQQPLSRSSPHQAGSLSPQSSCSTSPSSASTTISRLTPTRKARPLILLAAWILTQAIWLWQAYRLEMLGESTFVPGLWLSSLAFFAVNCWILGCVVRG